MKIDGRLTPKGLKPQLDRFFDLAAGKIHLLDKAWDPAKGSPVFTVRGKYTTRGWTEWTQGFQFGIQILQFDATGDKTFLKMGRKNTDRFMAPHVSHTGVHDHGFNNVSTYGNLRRLALEGKSGEGEEAVNYYAMALKASGAAQAARWTTIHDGTGYICSFNGPQSLFSDTIRSCRALVLADRLGHVLMGEGDRKINLLGRAIEHIHNTAHYNVYYGKGRDRWDRSGRVVHESIFNTNDGNYRCPSTQQGYSPFTTWTRGLSWIVTGAAEELEFFDTLKPAEYRSLPCGKEIIATMERMAKATCDFYIENTALDGVPYWDTGAPGLVHLKNWAGKRSMPDNPHEPVDGSAAAITAQGLLRFGRRLGLNTKAGKRYFQAGLTVARTLFEEPYLSTAPRHQGLLLHSVYHQPNGWDYVPKGKKVPQGESSMWGDYHLMELAVYLKRLIDNEPYYTFFGPTA